MAWSEVLSRLGPRGGPRESAIAGIAEGVAAGRAGWRRATPEQPYRFPPAERFGSRRIDFRDQFEAIMPELGVLSLEGGIVVAPDGWVFDRRRQFFPEPSWYGKHVDQLLERETVPARPRPTERIRGVALSLGTNWGDHYGHFVTDAIGRLGVALASGVDLGGVDRVLVPTVPNSQAARELLDRSGIPPEKIGWLASGTIFQADVLLVPSYPGLRRQYSSLVADYLRSLYPPRSGGRRLFVTRRGYPAIRSNPTPSSRWSRRRVSRSTTPWRAHNRRRTSPMRESSWGRAARGSPTS